MECTIDDGTKGRTRMSCDICRSSSCTAAFHSVEEQERYTEVILAFERARELRRELEEDDEH